MYSKYLYFVVKFHSLLIPNWFGFIKKYCIKTSVVSDQFKINFIWLRYQNLGSAYNRSHSVQRSFHFFLKKYLFCFSTDPIPTLKSSGQKSAGFTLSAVTVHNHCCLWNMCQSISILFMKTTTKGINPSAQIPRATN